MSIFKLPDLGEGLPDAEIVEWHVKVGDKVAVDQPMVSMETAKAVVDVPVPVDGVVSQLYGEPGDVIDTGAPLIEFNTGNDANTAQVKVEPANAAGSSDDSAAKLRAEAEQVLKDLHDNSASTAEKPAVKEAIGTVVGQMESSDTVLDSMTDFGGKKAAPAVRALAKKLGVDLSTVNATGTGGVIRPSDVKAAAANPSTKAPQAAPASKNTANSSSSETHSPTSSSGSQQSGG